MDNITLIMGGEALSFDLSKDDAGKSLALAIKAHVEKEREAAQQEVQQSLVKLQGEHDVLQSLVIADTLRMRKAMDKDLDVKVEVAELKEMSATRLKVENERAARDYKPGTQTLNAEPEPLPGTVTGIKVIQD